jgi:ABC-type transporter Mla subunit MlaD
MVIVPSDTQRMPLVRRGYDPYEVQRVVGELTSEIGALRRANAELRRRLEELTHAHEHAAALGAQLHHANLQISSLLDQLGRIVP